MMLSSSYLSRSFVPTCKIITSGALLAIGLQWSISTLYSTSGIVQYIGGYHEYIGAYHEYIGEGGGVFSTSGGYHDACGRYHEYTHYTG